MHLPEHQQLTGEQCVVRLITSFNRDPAEGRRAGARKKAKFLIVFLPTTRDFCGLSFAEKTVSHWVPRRSASACTTPSVERPGNLFDRPAALHFSNRQARENCFLLSQIETAGIGKQSNSHWYKGL